jgi:hypothetical protein
LNGLTGAPGGALAASWRDVRPKQKDGFGSGPSGSPSVRFGCGLLGTLSGWPEVVGHLGACSAAILASVHYWDTDIRQFGRSRNGLRVVMSAVLLMAAARLVAGVTSLMGQKPPKVDILHLISAPKIRNKVKAPSLVRARKSLALDFSEKTSFEIVL